jgi:hypothetical protein
LKHEFTVTLKPYLYAKSAKLQFEHTSPLLLRILQGYKVTAIAELTKAHNIHFHAIVEIDGILEKDGLLNKLRGYKEFGKHTCESVRYEESYEEYIKEDRIITEKIIKQSAILKDDYNIFKLNEQALVPRLCAPAWRNIVSTTPIVTTTNINNNNNILNVSRSAPPTPIAPSDACGSRVSIPPGEDYWTITFPNIKFKS